MTLNNYRYTAVAIGLHWAIAIGIIGMIAMGWYMGDLPNDHADKAALFQLHKSIGITILVASIARILWRVLNRPPEEPPAAAWQQTLAGLTHFAFYALMILMPLTGWVLVSASKLGLPTLLFDTINWPHLPGLPSLDADTKDALHPILENAHGKLAWVMIGLLALHVGAALKHQFLDRDQLISRMVPVGFGETDGAPARPRGALLAFGGAAAFFFLVVISGMFGGASAAAPTVQATPADAVTANWSVDHAQSKIGFSGVYNKDAFEGEFSTWTAAIDFDLSSPDAAAVIVTVDTASATTGSNYNDNSLKGADFFDVANHPQAMFTANGVFALEVPDTYEVTAVLTLKGVDHPVRMPFTLTFSDDQALMMSTFSLSRSALGLGLVNDPNAEWIDDEIVMNVSLVATRKGT